MHIIIKQHIKTILLGVAGLFISNATYAQTCPQPVVSSIDPLSTESVHIDWFVNTDLSVFFEIEMVLRDSSFLGVPSITNITDTEYTYDGLLAGKSYAFNVRTVCDTGPSIWNGPYFFNTNIDNSTSDCNLDFAIADDNCPVGNQFRIYVDGFSDKQLGDNIFLSNVELIIDHPWPPDLKLELISPEGKGIVLSQHKGLYARHFGNPQDSFCNQTVQFSDLACSTLRENNGQLIGSYLPDQSISDLYANQSPNGVWTLAICDRANGDEGLLKHVKLSFNEITCAVPEVVSVFNVTDEAVSLEWSQALCQDIKFTYGLRGFNPLTGDLGFVDCDSTSFTIDGLAADTEYDFYVSAICINQQSPLSCPFPIKTLCSIPLAVSSFDQDSLCDRSCLENCDISGVWTNARFDDLDWKINSGETPTLFTGPEHAVHNIGNYIYLENQTEICNADAEAMLISSCLQVNSLNTGCDLSFWYHMRGIGINELSLEILVEGAQDWEEIRNYQGTQDLGWQQEQIDFSEYDTKLIRLRFIGKTGTNNFADIALDQIVLSGLISLGNGISYFKDNDQDGYGNLEEAIIICSSNAIPNHVTNGQDCDDTNAQVNPGMEEVLCNLLDDNCNGIEDDVSDIPLEYELLSVSLESCAGSSDGSINLAITSGTEPYFFAWSNGETTDNPSLFNLSEGLYNCTITDDSGCISISDSILVEADHQLLISVQALENPNCLGSTDGEISIIAGNGVPPYEYEWNNGMEGPSISNLASAIYWATISDAAGCRLITDPFDLSVSNSLDGGVEFIQHLDCFNNQNGVIRVKANSGIEPYTYQWEHGPTTAEVSQLSRGFYSVTINDHGGCQQVIENIEITQPDDLDIVVNNIENNLCYNDNNGSIQVTAVGGEAPYSFLWSNGSLNDDISNLVAGSYFLTVSDINGCSFESGPIRVTEGDEMTISIDSMNTSTCTGSTDGFLRVKVDGGSGDYSYYWSDTNFVNTPLLSSIVSDFYSVTVVDELGCKIDMQNIFVDTKANVLDVSTTVIQPLHCFGDSNALVNVQVDSAELPLVANWDFGFINQQDQSNFNQNGLYAGGFNLTITDNNGCIGTDYLFIDQPEPIVLEEIEKINNLCFGDSLGEIKISVSGGTGDKTMSWFHGYNGDLVDNLPNGDYKVIISDELFCQLVSDEISITSPDILEMEAVIAHSSSANDGSANIFPLGGESPYRYKWDDSEIFTSNNNFTNLAPGMYPLAIRDKNNCVLDTIIEIELIINTFTEATQGKIIAYPNPSRDVISISPITTKSRIVVYNTNGLKLFEDYCNQGMYKYSMINLDPGIYFIEVVSLASHQKEYLKVLKY